LLPVPEFQRLRPDHASADLAFERENRAYFAASVSDRGDEFFEHFADRHAELLAEQAAPAPPIRPRGRYRGIAARVRCGFASYFAVCAAADSGAVADLCGRDEPRVPRN
jgi:hypothetical protein